MVYRGFGSARERAREAERNSCSGVIRSGDGGGRGANDFVARAIEVRATAFGRSDVVCGGHGFASGSEPGAELADGAAGVCRSCQFVDNAALIPRLVSSYLRFRLPRPFATF